MTTSRQTAIYTDGSAVPNPGPGGWAAVCVEDDDRVRWEIAGTAAHTTNNRMELTALIEALRRLPADAEINIHTDSQLCRNTLEVWGPKWQRNGWRKNTRGEIKNLDLVRQAVALRQARPGCRILWIQGHYGNRWNERADRLAGGHEAPQHAGPDPVEAPPEATAPAPEKTAGTPMLHVSAWNLDARSRDRVRDVLAAADAAEIEGANTWLVRTAANPAEWADRLRSAAGRAGTAAATERPDFLVTRIAEGQGAASVPAGIREWIAGGRPA